MALNKANTNTTAAAQFEDMDVGDTAEVVQAAATQTAVAMQAPRALAAPANTAAAVISQNVLAGMKDAFRVDYDSLPGIGASQGTFTLKADDEDIGNEIKLQLISYQASHVASPNDTKADIELVKYSDDGITSRDGVNLAAHIEDLKAQGYKNAKIAHRVILVGELVAAAKETDKIGELVMIDLPDSGRRAFNTFTLQASYAVARGRKTPEEASLLTLKAVPEKTRNGDKYTKVAIS